MEESKRYTFFYQCINDDDDDDDGCFAYPMSCNSVAPCPSPGNPSSQRQNNDRKLTLPKNNFKKPVTEKRNMRDVKRKISDKRQDRRIQRNVKTTTTSM